MNDHDDITRRLEALGRQPVDPHLADRHLSAMAAAPTPRFFARNLRIAGAFLAGLIAGTTGLATAGALPDPVQQVAHHTLGAVGFDVPPGARYQGPECGGEVKNHGQYVSSQPKGSRAEAARSRCGMPVHAGGGGAPSGECHGPPPWAGKGKPDEAAKRAFQAARKARCGDAGAATAPSSEPADPGGSTTTTTAATPGGSTTPTTAATPGGSTTPTTAATPGGSTAPTTSDDDEPTTSTTLEDPRDGDGGQEDGDGDGDDGDDGDDGAGPSSSTTTATTGP